MGIWARNKEGESAFDSIPAALNTLKHRGPDNQSYKIYSNLALGHTRLSIIDLSNEANQPFSSDDGRYHLVFNGEIYNYRELREGLKDEGVNFKTQSDTEVLLQVIIRFGKDGVHKLNGFFAFIFFDQLEKKLLVVRDRLGIKPLLYAIDDSKIVIASELKAFSCFAIDSEIDHNALRYYFQYSFIPAPWTILKGVKKLMPGEMLCVSANEIRCERYYSLPTTADFNSDFEQAKVGIRERLNKAVERRLVADVPVGSFLSGGLDSSIIATIAKEQKTDIETFSIGFDHPFFNETNYAEEVARHIGSKHQTIILSQNSFTSQLDGYLNTLDEPFADSSSFAYYILSGETKKRVTVALSGDGADELFGGYRKHLAEARIRNMGNFERKMIRAGSSVFGHPSESRSSRIGDLKRKVKKLGELSILDDEERYGFLASWTKPDICKKLLLHPAEDFQFPFQLKTLNDFLYRDQVFVLPNDMLKKADLMSMAHALEVRVPFLDHELVAFVNSLPANYKIKGTTGKYILRETFRNNLPERILKRSKKGFEIPLEFWLDKQLTDILQRHFFSKEYILEQQLFNEQFIRELIGQFQAGKAGERIYVLWALIVFQHWYYHFFSKA